MRSPLPEILSGIIWLQLGHVQLLKGHGAWVVVAPILQHVFSIFHGKAKPLSLFVAQVFRLVVDRIFIHRDRCRVNGGFRPACFSYDHIHFWDGCNKHVQFLEYFLVLLHPGVRHTAGHQ